MSVCLLCASPVYFDFIDMASDMAVVDYMLSFTSPRPNLRRKTISTCITLASYTCISVYNRIFVCIPVVRVE